MNNGAFGENFPYTNFHDLNLDWIIKELKKLRDDSDRIEEIRDQAEEQADRAQEASEIAVNSANEAEQYALDALRRASKRRYVFVGDSYGQGWSPDGNTGSWINRVVQTLDIEQGDYYSVAEGGSGFWVDTPSDPRYIPAMIQSIYASITNPDTITDIVMGFGYNDINKYDNPSALQSVATSVLGKIRTLFPQNPRIWLFGIGYTTSHVNQYKLMYVYSTYASFAGFGFIKMSDCLTNTSLFSSDGIHPNANGQNKISQTMSQLLNYGEKQSALFTRYSMDVNVLFKNLITDANFNGPVYVYRQDDRLIITCPTSSFLRTTFPTGSLLTLSRTPVKIGKYENTLLTGFHNWSAIGQMFPCDIVYQASDVAGYHSVNGYINIAPESDADNNLYIWLSVFKTTDDYTNYLTIENITSIQIAGFNMQFKQIG